MGAMWNWNRFSGFPDEFCTEAAKKPLKRFGLVSRAPSPRLKQGVNESSAHGI